MSCRQCSFTCCFTCCAKWNNGCPQCRLESWEVFDLTIVEDSGRTYSGPLRWVLRDKNMYISMLHKGEKAMGHIFTSLNEWGHMSNLQKLRNHALNKQDFAKYIDTIQEPLRLRLEGPHRGYSSMYNWLDKKLSEAGCDEYRMTIRELVISPSHFKKYIEANGQFF